MAANRSPSSLSPPPDTIFDATTNTFHHFHVRAFEPPTITFFQHPATGEYIPDAVIEHVYYVTDQDDVKAKPRRECHIYHCSHGEDGQPLDIELFHASPHSISMFDINPSPGPNHQATPHAQHLHAHNLSHPDTSSQPPGSVPTRSTTSASTVRGRTSSQAQPSDQLDHGLIPTHHSPVSRSSHKHHQPHPHDRTSSTYQQQGDSAGYDSPHVAANSPSKFAISDHALWAKPRSHPHNAQLHNHDKDHMSRTHRTHVGASPFNHTHLGVPRDQSPPNAYPYRHHLNHHDSDSYSDQSDPESDGYRKSQQHTPQPTRANIPTPDSTVPPPRKTTRRTVEDMEREQMTGEPRDYALKNGAQLHFGSVSSTMHSSSHSSSRNHRSSNEQRGERKEGVEQPQYDDRGANDDQRHRHRSHPNTASPSHSGFQMGPSADMYPPSSSPHHSNHPTADPNSRPRHQPRHNPQISGTDLSDKDFDSSDSSTPPISTIFSSIMPSNRHNPKPHASHSHTPSEHKIDQLVQQQAEMKKILHDLQLSQSQSLLHTANHHNTSTFSLGSNPLHSCLSGSSMGVCSHPDHTYSPTPDHPNASQIHNPCNTHGIKCIHLHTDLGNESVVGQINAPFPLAFLTKEKKKKKKHQQQQQQQPHLHTTPPPVPLPPLPSAHHAYTHYQSTHDPSERQTHPHPHHPHSLHPSSQQSPFGSFSDHHHSSLPHHYNSQSYHPTHPHDAPHHHPNHRSSHSPSSSPYFGHPPRQLTTTDRGTTTNYSAATFSLSSGPSTHSSIHNNSPVLSPYLYHPQEQARVHPSHHYQLDPAGQNGDRRYNNDNHSAQYSPSLPPSHDPYVQYDNRYLNQSYRGSQQHPQHHDQQLQHQPHYQSHPHYHPHNHPDDATHSLYQAPDPHFQPSHTNSHHSPPAPHSHPYPQYPPHPQPRAQSYSSPTPSPHLQSSPHQPSTHQVFPHFPDNPNDFNPSSLYLPVHPAAPANPTNSTNQHPAPQLPPHPQHTPDAPDTFDPIAFPSLITSRTTARPTSLSSRLPTALVPNSTHLPPTSISRVAPPSAAHPTQDHPQSRTSHHHSDYERPHEQHRQNEQRKQQPQQHSHNPSHPHPDSLHALNRSSNRQPTHGHHRHHSDLHPNDHDDQRQNEQSRQESLHRSHYTPNEEQQYQQQRQHHHYPAHAPFSPSSAFIQPIPSTLHIQAITRDTTFGREAMGQESISADHNPRRADANGKKNKTTTRGTATNDIPSRGPPQNVPSSHPDPRNPPHNSHNPSTDAASPINPRDKKHEPSHRHHHHHHHADHGHDDNLEGHDHNYDHQDTFSFGSSSIESLLSPVNSRSVSYTTTATTPNTTLMHADSPVEDGWVSPMQPQFQDGQRRHHAQAPFLPTTNTTTATTKQKLNSVYPTQPAASTPPSSPLPATFTPPMSSLASAKLQRVQNIIANIAFTSTAHSGPNSVSSPSMSFSLATSSLTPHPLSPSSPTVMPHHNQQEQIQQRQQQHQKHPDTTTHERRAANPVVHVTTNEDDDPSQPPPNAIHHRSSLPPLPSANLPSHPALESHHHTNSSKQRQRHQRQSSSTSSQTHDPPRLSRLSSPSFSITSLTSTTSGFLSSSSTPLHRHHPQHARSSTPLHHSQHHQQPPMSTLSTQITKVNGQDAVLVKMNGSIRGILKNGPNTASNSKHGKGSHNHPTYTPQSAQTHSSSSSSETYPGSASSPSIHTPSSIEAVEFSKFSKLSAFDSHLMPQRQTGSNQNRRRSSRFNGDDGPSGDGEDEGGSDLSCEHDEFLDTFPPEPDLSIHSYRTECQCDCCDDIYRFILYPQLLAAQEAGEEPDMDDIAQGIADFQHQKLLLAAQEAVEDSDGAEHDHDHHNHHHPATAHGQHQRDQHHRGSQSERVQPSNQHIFFDSFGAGLQDHDIDLDHDQNGGGHLDPNHISRQDLAAAFFQQHEFDNASISHNDSQTHSSSNASTTSSHSSFSSSSQPSFQEHTSLPPHHQPRHHHQRQEHQQRDHQQQPQISSDPQHPAFGAQLPPSHNLPSDLHHTHAASHSQHRVQFQFNDHFVSQFNPHDPRAPHGLVEDAIEFDDVNSSATQSGTDHESGDETTNRNSHHQPLHHASDSPPQAQPHHHHHPNRDFSHPKASVQAQDATSSPISTHSRDITIGRDPDNSVKKGHKRISAPQDLENQAQSAAHRDTGITFATFSQSPKYHYHPSSSSLSRPQTSSSNVNTVSGVNSGPKKGTGGLSASGTGTGINTANTSINNTSLTHTTSSTTRTAASNTQAGTRTNSRTTTAPFASPTTSFTYSASSKPVPILTQSSASPMTPPRQKVAHDGSSGGTTSSSKQSSLNTTSTTAIAASKPNNNKNTSTSISHSRSSTLSAASSPPATHTTSTSVTRSLKAKASAATASTLQATPSNTTSSTRQPPVTFVSPFQPPTSSPQQQLPPNHLQKRLKQLQSTGQTHNQPPSPEFSPLSHTSSSSLPLSSPSTSQFSPNSFASSSHAPPFHAASPAANSYSLLHSPQDPSHRPKSHSNAQSRFPTHSATTASTTTIDSHGSKRNGATTTNATNHNHHHFRPTTLHHSSDESGSEDDSIYGNSPHFHSQSQPRLHPQTTTTHSPLFNPVDLTDQQSEHSAVLSLHNIASTYNRHVEMVDSADPKRPHPPQQQQQQQRHHFSHSNTSANMSSTMPQHPANNNSSSTSLHGNHVPSKSKRHTSFLTQHRQPAMISDSSHDDSDV